MNLSLQGLHRIHIGFKMQEVAARYQGEGLSHIYVACASTNTQRLIDLFENTFGDLDEPDLEELEMDTMKSLHEQAAAAESRCRSY